LSISSSSSFRKSRLDTWAVCGWQAFNASEAIVSVDVGGRMRKSYQRLGSTRPDFDMWRSGESFQSSSGVDRSVFQTCIAMDL
jgi:hypothetical protein